MFQVWTAGDALVMDAGLLHRGLAKLAKGCNGKAGHLRFSIHAKTLEFPFRFPLCHTPPYRPHARFQYESYAGSGFASSMKLLAKAGYGSHIKKHPANRIMV